jgi:hypothetical protein
MITWPSYYLVIVFRLFEYQQFGLVFIKAVPVFSFFKKGKYISVGCSFYPQSKRLSLYRIGTEHEKFGFEVDTLRPIKYDQIRDILNGLAERFDWDKIMEGDTVIGLKQVQFHFAPSLLHECGRYISSINN